LRAAETDFFRAIVSGAPAFLVLLRVVFSIRQTAIAVREKSATRKREIGRVARKRGGHYGVTRGSPAGVIGGRKLYTQGESTELYTQRA
jgi:hypothetical protein